jgi:hypothetical protein
VFIKKEKQPAIWVYENAFDCGDFIEKIESESERDWAYLSWSSSGTGGGGQGMVSEYRTSYEMSLTNLLQENISDGLKDLSDHFIEIFKDIDQCVWDYRNCFNLELRGNDGFNLLKYGPSGEYHNHHDHAPNNSRVLSLVANLGDDHDGGELEFPYFDISLKLQKNSLILFPSNFPYTHVANPVLSGLKYSLVTWFQ